jgi:hypothetical protein
MLEYTPKKLYLEGASKLQGATWGGEGVGLRKWGRFLEWIGCIGWATKEERIYRVGDILEEDPWGG